MPGGVVKRNYGRREGGRGGKDTTEERKASRFRHYAPMSQFLFSKGKGSGGQGKYGMDMPSPLA
jgi:hypothetical protein